MFCGLQWIFPPTERDKNWRENTDSNIDEAVGALSVHVRCHTDIVVESQEGITCLKKKIIYSFFWAVFASYSIMKLTILKLDFDDESYFIKLHVKDARLWSSKN